MSSVYEKVSTRLLCEMLHLHLQKLKQRLEATANVLQGSHTSEEHEAFTILLQVITRDYAQSSRDQKVEVVRTWFNDIVVFTRKFPVNLQSIVHVLHYRLNDAPREFEFVASPIIEHATLESTINDVE